MMLKRNQSKTQLEDDDSFIADNDDGNQNLKDIAVADKNSNFKEKTKNKQIYTCEKCSKSFSKKGHLLLHIRCHTGEKPHICNVCQRSFTQKGDLTRHLRLHTGEKPFKCDKCDRAFSHKSNLRQHASLHNGNRPFRCDSCAKTFSRKSILRQHQRLHSGLKPFECDLCQKTFPRKGGLLQHIRQHTGDWPFKCESCDKGFSDKSHLTCHMRVHSGEKPFDCNVCNRTFADKSNLNRHAKTHHRNVSSEDGGINLEFCQVKDNQSKKPVDFKMYYDNTSINLDRTSFKCEHCLKEFALKSNIIKHMRLHTGEKPYCCLFCNKAFSHKSNLTRHTKLHYSNKTYPCLKCKKVFYNKGGLVQHNDLHHGLKNSKFLSKLPHNDIRFESDIEGNSQSNDSVGNSQAAVSDSHLHSESAKHATTRNEVAHISEAESSEKENELPTRKPTRGSCMEKLASEGKDDLSLVQSNISLNHYNKTMTMECETSSDQIKNSYIKEYTPLSTYMNMTKNLTTKRHFHHIPDVSALTNAVPMTERGEQRTKPSHSYRVHQKSVFKNTIDNCSLSKPSHLLPTTNVAQTPSKLLYQSCPFNRSSCPFGLDCPNLGSHISQHTELPLPEQGTNSTPAGTSPIQATNTTIPLDLSCRNGLNPKGTTKLVTPEHNTTAAYTEINPNITSSNIGTISLQYRGNSDINKELGSTGTCNRSPHSSVSYPAVPTNSYPAGSFSQFNSHIQQQYRCYQSNINHAIDYLMKWIANFQTSNLHVNSYAEPRSMSQRELEKEIFNNMHRSMTNFAHVPPTDLEIKLGWLKYGYPLKTEKNELMKTELDISDEFCDDSTVL